MKILAASDLHGVVDIEALDVSGVDVCVLAGDIAPLRALAPYGRLAQLNWVLEVFIPFMKTHESTEFAFIAGNHDFWGLAKNPDDADWPRNAHFLDNSGCEINGVKFFGLPQVPVINGMWANEVDPDMMRAACDMIPSDTDVLITHTPPRIAGSDIDSSKGTFLINGQAPHFGSSELTEAIERVQPKYNFCGHIHTGDHSCVEIGATKCFNVSLLDEEYKQHYSPFVEEIEFS